MAGAGAVGGALWGGLIGLIFFVPLLGMAIGAATGAAAGALSEYGVDDNFMKELGQSLEPGGAAVILLVRKVSVDKVLPEIKIQGKMIRTSLDNESEQRLSEALAAAGRPVGDLAAPARAVDQPARKGQGRDSVRRLAGEQARLEVRDQRRKLLPLFLRQISAATASYTNQLHKSPSLLRAQAHHMVAGEQRNFGHREQLENRYPFQPRNMAGGESQWAADEG